MTSVTLIGFTALASALCLVVSGVSAWQARSGKTRLWLVLALILLFLAAYTVMVGVVMLVQGTPVEGPLPKV